MKVSNGTGFKPGLNDIIAELPYHDIIKMKKCL